MSLNDFDSLQNAKKQLEKLMGTLTKAERQQLLVYGIEEWMTIKMGDESASDTGNFIFIINEYLFLINY